MFSSSDKVVLTHVTDEVVEGRQAVLTLCVW